MELRHLRYFIAVAEAKGVTRAAERLGLQQPPLSQQIKDLEKELGFALFRRLPRGVELTAGGEAFYQDAVEILGRVERAATRASRTAQGLVGALTVSLTSSALTHPFTPGVLAAFHESYPGVEVGVREGNAAEVTDAVAARKADVGIIRAPVLHPADLVFEPLLREEMLAAIPSSHPLARGRAGEGPPIPLQSLARETFIFVRRPGAPGLYADVIDACHRAGFTPTVGFEVGSMVTNVTLVAAGLGVSIVPGSMRDLHRASILYCRLKGASRLWAPITLVKRREDPNPATQRFAALAHRLATSAKSSRPSAPRR